MLIKILVALEQQIGTLYKEIELPAIPYPGTLFQYQPGWSLEPIVPASEPGLHLKIGQGERGISVSGYLNFNASDRAKLISLGWELS